MRIKKITGILLMLLTTAHVFAQLPAITQPKPLPSPFEKKFLFGVSANTCVTTIRGNATANDYFAKPSLGGLISAEYYPLQFIGFGAGIGFQQRGAGIKTIDKVPVVGLNPDSANNRRLRFNTVEIPLTLILRTPKDIIKGVRLSGAFSVVPMINIRSNDVFNSYEAGIRQIDHVNDVSSSYFKHDVAWQIALGPEIDSGGSGIFKFQFLYSQGTTNVYTAGQGKAHNQLVGFRVAFMF